METTFNMFRAMSQLFFECVFGEKRISIFRCARVVFLVSFESVFSSVFMRFFVFFSSFGMILVPFSCLATFFLFFFPRACVFWSVFRVWRRLFCFFPRSKNLEWHVIRIILSKSSISLFLIVPTPYTH